MKNRAKKRIAIVTSNLGTVGGAERLILNISRGINRDEFDLGIISLCSKGSIGKAIEEEGWRVYGLGLGSLNPIYTVPNTMRLYRVLKEVKPDVIHSHLSAANYYSRLANVFIRKPIVITEHNMYLDRRKWQIVIDKALSYSTDVIVAVSHSVMEFTSKQERINKDKFTVIYDAIDVHKYKRRNSDVRMRLRKELGINQDSTTLINVARLTSQKGQEYLLRAFKTVLEINGKVELVIVGTGRLEEDLKEEAKELRIDHRVHFLGVRTDIPELLNMSDIFVFPSLWEGLGLALLEAMAMELPVIVSDIPPFREVVRNGKNGLTVPPRDEDKLAQAVIQLVDDRELSRKLGIEARKTVERDFTIEKCVGEHENLYRNLALSH